MSVYRRGRSPFWYYDFQIDGVRFRGSTQQKDKAAAKIIESKRRTDAALNARGLRRRSMTLNAAFGKYYDEHAKRLPSAANIDYQLANLLAIGCERALADIGDADVAEYVARRRAAVSDASVNREVTLLRAVFRRAADQWEIDVGTMPNGAGTCWPNPSAECVRLPSPRKRACLNTSGRTCARWCGSA